MWNDIHFWLIKCFSFVDRRSEEAPPLPPKTKTHKGSSPDNFKTKYITSPIGHSSPLNHSPRESSLDWSHSPAVLVSTDRCSGTTNSSDQVSPASSLDSMLHSHDDPSTPRTVSLISCGSLHDRPDLDFESALNKNLNIERGTSIPRLTDSGYPSLTSIQSTASSNR